MPRETSGPSCLDTSSGDGIGETLWWPSWEPGATTFGPRGIPPPCPPARLGFEARQASTRRYLLSRVLPESGFDRGMTEARTTDALFAPPCVPSEIPDGASSCCVAASRGHVAGEARLYVPGGPHRRTTPSCTCFVPYALSGFGRVARPFATPAPLPPAPSPLLHRLDPQKERKAFRDRVLARRRTDSLRRTFGALVTG